MLYIWPYISFFSFPTLLPSLIPTVHTAIPPRLRSYLPQSLRQLPSTKHFSVFRQLAIAVGFVAITVPVIKYNTLVHPFTLADNRHFTFYVFRLLLKHPATKYLVAPVYFTLSFACIHALGGVESPKSSATPQSPPATSRQVPTSTLRNQDSARSTRVSFAIIWLVTSALSLITAPLVEPRYFIIPWVIWRLNVPVPPEVYFPKRPTTSSRKQNTSSNDGLIPQIIERTVSLVQKHSLALETIWFLAINAGVGYIFLNWGFEWSQDKGVVQRFMW